MVAANGCGGTDSGDGRRLQTVLVAQPSCQERLLASFAETHIGAGGDSPPTRQTAAPRSGTQDFSSHQVGENDLASCTDVAFAF